MLVESDLIYVWISTWNWTVCCLPRGNLFPNATHAAHEALKLHKFFTNEENVTGI